MSERVRVRPCARLLQAERDANIFECEAQRDAALRDLSELRERSGATLRAAAAQAAKTERRLEADLSSARQALGDKTAACKAFFEEAESHMMVQRQQIVHLRQRWVEGCVLSSSIMREARVSHSA